MGAKDSGLFILVKQGTITDFFSVPWIARWLVPKTTRGNQAAGMHDEGYKTGMLMVRVDGKTKPVPALKSAIDSMFLEGMKVLDHLPPPSNDFKSVLIYQVKWTQRFLRRQAIYRAVQCFGFVRWNKCRKLQAARA